MYNVVVIVNGGTKIIPHKLLDELAQAAGADSWECISLPDPERNLTTDAPDQPAQSGATCTAPGCNEPAEYHFCEDHAP